MLGLIAICWGQTENCVPERSFAPNCALPVRLASTVNHGRKSDNAWSRKEMIEHELFAFANRCLRMLSLRQGYL